MGLRTVAFGTAVRGRSRQATNNDDLSAAEAATWRNVQGGGAGIIGLTTETSVKMRAAAQKAMDGTRPMHMIV